MLKNLLKSSTLLVLLSAFPIMDVSLAGSGNSREKNPDEDEKRIISKKSKNINKTEPIEYKAINPPDNPLQGATFKFEVQHGINFFIWFINQF